MAIDQTFNCKVDSTVYEINVSYFVPRSVLIENHSGDSALFDNGTDPVYVIPPGATVPMNLFHYIYTLRIRTLTNTTGTLRITVSDSERDVSNAPVLQQLPGGVSITGDVTIPGTVTTQPALPVGGRLHLNGNTQAVVLAHTTTRLVVQCDEPTLVIGGFLNVYTTVTLPDTTTAVIYLVAQQYLLPSYYAAQNSMIPFVSDPDTVLPEGAIVSVAFSGQGDFIVSY